MTMDGYLGALAQLEKLRRADEPYGRPVNWLKARRLAVFAECCADRDPLLAVMNTSPAVVLIGQAKAAPGAEPGSGPRRRWQGMTQDRGGFDVRLLECYPHPSAMVFHVWCRHRRWAVPVDVVFTHTGRRVLPVTDTDGHIG